MIISLLRGKAEKFHPDRFFDNLGYDMESPINEQDADNTSFHPAWLFHTYIREIIVGDLD